MGFQIRVAGVLSAVLVVLAGQAVIAQKPAIPATPAPSSNDAAEAPAPEPRPIAAVFELAGDPPQFRKLFDLPDNHRCNSPRVTADGKQLMFDGWNKVAGESSNAAHVFITNLDGSGMRSLCAGAMPSPSPDGKHFAYSSYGPDSGVCIRSLDGHEEKLIDRSGWGIQWSPDGTSVAYRRSRNVVVKKLADNSERLLFPETGGPYSLIYWNMAWSGDSRELAVVAGNAANELDLLTIDAQGAEFGFLTHAHGKIVPSLTWNADGKRLIYPQKVPGAYAFYEVDPRAGGEPQLVPGLPADSKATSATWSPDGTRLIVICNFN